MRTRNRTVVRGTWPSKVGYPYVATSYKCDGTTSTASATTPAIPARNFDYTSERITDSLGRNEPHNVVHRSMSHYMGDYGGALYPAYSNGYGRINYGAYTVDIGRESVDYWMNTLAAWDVNSNSSMPDGWSIVPPVINDQVIINDLMEDAKGLTADVLLNIIEANQIWPSIRSLAQCLPQMRRHWVRNDLRRLMKTASSSFLAWKFGVSPIIQDLTNIVRHYGSMGQQFDIFRKRGTQRFSRTFPINPTFAKAPVQSTANGQIGTQVSYTGALGIKPVVRYVLVVRPVAPPRLSAAFDALHFAMQRFSTSPAALAWERIPFSFVADWFVDLRGVLDTLDGFVGFKPYEVVSLTKSVSWEVATTVSMDSYATCASHEKLRGGPLGQRRYKHYERSRLSRQALPIWNPRFGKNQAGITAALIGQKLKL